MESNRDESNRCAALAKQYLAEGDREKAKKFMNKAHRLFATDETKQFLEDLESAKTSTTDEQTRRRKLSKGNVATENGTGPETAESTNYRRDDEYTDEQKNLVNRVNKCKDYYEVLEVTKTATDTEIKKAYKKIALKLHPDKNKCPGAIEAFKKVGNAVAVLSDSEKRKQYDLYGSTNRGGGANGSSSFSNATSSFHSFDFEQDNNVEEIFNLFFGNAFNRPTVFTRSRHNDFFRHSATFQRQEQFTNNSREQHHGFAQILPLIIAIVLSIMVTWFQSEPVFSLRRSDSFRNLRRTHIHELPFYVKDSFQHTFHGSIYDLEQDILFEMKSECRREHYRKKQRIYNAQLHFNSREEKFAKEIKLEFCDILRSKNIVIN